MKRSLLNVLALAFACQHGGPAARWNQQDYVLSASAAIDATTRRPLLAMANSAGAVVFHSVPGPRTSTQMDSRDARGWRILRNGSAYGDAFAKGQADVLWNAMGEDARRERKDLESLRTLVDSTLARLGPETRVRAEYVEETSNGASYLRDSEYANAPAGMVLELAFEPDSTSKLARLSVYPAQTRPVAVQTLEPPNAPR